MEPMQTEISDRLKNKKITGTLTTGSWFIYTGSTETIRCVSLHVPVLSNSNINAQVEYSLDKGLTWSSLNRGNHVSVECRPDDDVVDLRTTVNNTSYVLTLLLEDTGGE